MLESLLPIGIFPKTRLDDINQMRRIIDGANDAIFTQAHAMEIRLSGKLFISI